MAWFTDGQSGPPHGMDTFGTGGVGVEGQGVLGQLVRRDQLAEVRRE